MGRADEILEGATSSDLEKLISKFRKQESDLKKKRNFSKKDYSDLVDLQDNVIPHYQKEWQKAMKAEGKDPTRQNSDGTFWR